MTDEEFLQQVLDEQTLASDSQEHADLLAEHDRIAALLESELEDSRPSIELGGSLAKGTIVRASYDLDSICYFDNDDNGSGETLKEIREAVEEALRTEYKIEGKRSAIKLVGRLAGELRFPVDVVPGRYVDESREDVFLHQADGEKERLKTNLKKHIEHISGSGQLDIIKLAKVWKLRSDIEIKTFVLELVAIECLKDVSETTLRGRLVEFWTVLRDDMDSISIEDPANPTGNDLADVFGDSEREALSTAATIALDLVDESDWAALFGDLGTESIPSNRAIVSPRALLALGDTSHVKQHDWPVRRGHHQVGVTCSAFTRRGGRRTLDSNGHPVTDGTRFRFEASTDVPPPFDVRWQVVNTGAHAQDENGLRGREFMEARTNTGDPSTGLVHRETAEYTGKHWVECFIIKEGALWARSSAFYVNIISRQRRRTRWRPWRR
ncbi:nucleotidyltransferase [Candidatus Bipolaricaulota bacterium]|nr:nucleotidyltransferase [Candidatus Bipolaricaulota bacterium]